MAVQVNMYRLSYGQWSLLMELMRACDGDWKDLSKIETLIDKYQIEKDHIELATSESIDYMQQLLSIYASKMYDAWKKEGYCSKVIWKRLSWYGKYQGVIREEVVSRFSVDDSHESIVLWPGEIPLNMRFKEHNWWSRLVYGAHLFIDLGNTDLLLQIYWLKVRLKTAYPEELASLWDQYENKLSSVTSYLDSIHNTSWFWNWSLKKSIKVLKGQLEEGRNSTLSLLRETLGPQQQSNKIGILLNQNGFYEGLGRLLYTEKDWKQLDQTWQIYYPHWSASYHKCRGKNENNQSKLTAVLSEETIISQLVLASGNTYRYALIIRWFFEKGYDKGHDLWLRCYHKAKDCHPWFWRQFKTLSKFHSQKKWFKLISETYKASEYQDSELSEIIRSRRSQLAINRITLLQSQWLFAQYNQTLNKEVAYNYQSLVKDLFYQFSLNLPYESFKIATILWDSVLCVINLPKKCSDQYISQLSNCLCQQQSLPSDLAGKLQSHMAVVAKYAWSQKWSSKTALQLSNRLQSPKWPTWSCGMKRVKAAVTEQGQTEITKGVLV